MVGGSFTPRPRVAIFNLESAVTARISGCWRRSEGGRYRVRGVESGRTRAAATVPDQHLVLFTGESSGLGRAGYQEEPRLGESPWEHSAPCSCQPPHSSLGLQLHLLSVFCAGRHL